MKPLPGLYVAATPIGNLKDVTYRVVETLTHADTIYCEDTRQTAKLCQAYGVTTPRRAYNEHNADRIEGEILAALRAGAVICLVSDAGTPLISDPGARLVKAAREAGANVYPLPGPCAAVAALSASGASTERFLFAGFPPSRAQARKTFFDGLRDVDATLVFYESPARLAESLAAMAQAFGDRRAIVARELTKIHEELVADALSILAGTFGRDGARGEIVVIVEPPGPREPAGAAEIDAFIVSALKTMSVRDAANAAAEALGIARKTAYERALALAGRA